MGCYNIGYLSKTHLKPQSCRILFAHNSFLCYPIILKCCTEYGSDTALLCAKFQNDWATDTNATEEWHFTRFEFNVGFGWIPYLVTAPCWCQKHVSNLNSGYRHLHPIYSPEKEIHKHKHDERINKKVSNSMSDLSCALVICNIVLYWIAWKTVANILTHWGWVTHIENAFENVVWKIAAILPRPQCVNSYSPFMYKHEQHMLHIICNQSTCVVPLKETWWITLTD